MPDAAQPKPIDVNAIMPVRLRDVLQLKGFCERSGIPEGAALAEMLNAKYDLWLAEQELATARRLPTKGKPTAGAPEAEAAAGDAGAANRPAPPPPMNRQQRRAAEREAAKIKAAGATKPNGAHDATEATRGPAAD